MLGVYKRTNSTVLAGGIAALTERIKQKEKKQSTKTLTALFNKLVQLIAEREKTITFLKAKENSISATIKFTAEEIAQMDGEFGKVFKTTGSCARIIKTSQNGEMMYEIGYRRNGYRIEVSSTNIHEAKKKFIQESRLKTIKKECGDFGCLQTSSFVFLDRYESG